MRKIITIGPGPQFKGGIANYNTSLAKALDKQEDTEVHLVSWTQQYPAIVPRDFIDRKSKSDQFSGTDVKVHYLLNYNNPLTWQKTVQFIKNLKPDRVVIQWALTIQGIPLRYVARRLQKAGIQVYFDLHNVAQKENSNLDKWLTRRCICFSDTHIIHALKTLDELKELLPGKKFHLVQPGEKEFREKNHSDEIRVLKLYHPVYDMFSPDPSFDTEAFKTSLGLNKHVFLFFGFIRKYKGLHHVIEAFNLLSQQRDDVSLLIVGELFWKTLDRKKLSTRIKNAVFGLVKKLFLKKEDDEQNYRPIDLIKEYGIEEKVVAITEFVSNEDVHKYFQVSDVLTLFYLDPAPSGVASIAYNFGMPILATGVGHFPEIIKHGYNGYLAEPENPRSMAGIMLESINSPIPSENVFATSIEMSWANYASAILNE